MNKMYWILSFSILATATRALAVDPTEIMKKTEEVGRVNSLSSQVQLQTGTKNGETKTKVFESLRKLKGDGIHYDTVTRFTSPQDIRGQAVLFQEFKDNQNNVFLYLPRFKKLRRVEGYDQGKSFMGTVFSYSDITTFHYSNYKYKYLKQEPCGVEPGACHVIESIPATEEIKNRTQYSKSVLWVRAENTVVVRSDAYDLKGKLSKRLVMSQYKKLPSGKWVPLKIRADSLESKKFSVLEYSQVKADVAIPNSTFTEEGVSQE